jgi:hypothetical protein
LLILDGHESHHSTEFEQYCQEHDIITLCMPAHASHILQPLDVSCFGPLKKAYGKEVSVLMSKYITHITKVKFLACFKTAHYAAMTPSNVQGGFQGAGLVPHDPDAVLSKLDIVRTPSPQRRPQSTTPNAWVSQTPSNPTEAVSQSQFIRHRIAGHQNSSPTPIFTAVDKLARGTEELAHSVILLSAEVRTLQEANHILSKRRREKNTRLREGGPLTADEAYELLDEREIHAQLVNDMSGGGGSEEAEATVVVRRCGTCRTPGHNARSCPSRVELDPAS